MKSCFLCHSVDLKTKNNSYVSMQDHIWTLVGSNKLLNNCEITQPLYYRERPKSEGFDQVKF